MSKIVLQTDDLSKNFGQVTAVHSVNLRMQQGEIFGFLHPNGAGKTTTIGMVLGLSNSLAALNRVSETISTGLVTLAKGVGMETAVTSIALYTLFFVGLAIFVFRRQDLGG